MSDQLIPCPWFAIVSQADRRIKLKVSTGSALFRDIPRAGRFDVDLPKHKSVVSVRVDSITVDEGEGFATIVLATH